MLDGDIVPVEVAAEGAFLCSYRRPVGIIGKISQIKNSVIQSEIDFFAAGRNLQITRLARFVHHREGGVCKLIVKHSAGIDGSTEGIQLCYISDNQWVFS